MPMMPDPNSANRIRSLIAGLPSMPPTHIEPTPDIDVGPMQDFPAPQGGFEFEGHSMMQDPRQAPPSQKPSGNPEYDQMMQGRRDQYAQMMQARRDSYASRHR